MEAEAEHLTRSDIWHDDGSVVLQAESTQFRVHWSVLSLHSTFFRDMRGLPQPADQPSIEGCPVIQLHDSSVDVEHLLNALYNPHLFSAKELHLPLIAAIVRLAQIRLQKSPRCGCPTPHPRKSNDFAGIVHYDSIVFDVITLARENNLFAVLPCAYLRAIFFYNEEDILDGIPSTIRPRVTLSFHDQRTCILASKKILRAQWEHTRFEAWMSSDAPALGCTNRCSMKKKFIFQELLKSGLPLASFHHYATVEQQFCNACKLQHKEVIAEGRKKVWDDLPGFFGLPPWDELKNDI
ncbi:hypothetical protein B0H19DRAFT_1157418 [Mycena capillaripes]|nr:hypothetical protein B0H19DRAFT_1157418 [Mycena capillaripes]